MDLIKIFRKPEYAETFLNGNIRVCPARGYTKKKMDSARQDETESSIMGSYIDIDWSAPYQLINTRNGQMVALVPGIKEYCKECIPNFFEQDCGLASFEDIDPYILCTTNLPADKALWARTLSEAYDNGSKGDFIVLFRAEELLYNISEKAKEDETLKDFRCGEVQYIDGDKPKHVFEKKKKFIKEHEFRFAFPDLPKEASTDKDKALFIKVPPLHGFLLQITPSGIKVLKSFLDAEESKKA